MVAKVIDGKAIAASLRASLKSEVEALTEEYEDLPGLAVILVGSRTDSLTYVNMKKKACIETGLIGFLYRYPHTATQEEVLEKIHQLNELGAHR
jgi:5,10-methylene-tetrahydrofolate dehydrogenase/methenyl tetrahydrofolate cyclohydrolase